MTNDGKTPPAFTEGDFGEYLDAMERFGKYYDEVHGYLCAQGDGEEAQRALHHLLRMSIAHHDLKELFYHALKCAPRSAHLISADYYQSVAEMNDELRELGIADDESE